MRSSTAGPDVRTLRREAWFRGYLRYLLRPDAQTRIYDSILAWHGQHPGSFGPYVTIAHRGLGKSFEAVVLCAERCLRKPGQEVRFCAPTYTQAETIFLPLFRKILCQCPQELYPEKRLNTWTFRNPRWAAQGYGEGAPPSTLYVVSLKDDAEQLRGPRSNLIVVDEAREVPNLDYVIRDVLLYHFTDQEDPLMVLFSTLPKSLHHPLVSVFMANAVREEAYLKIGGHEDLDVSPRDESALLASLAWDRTSPTWRREWLCEVVADESALIIPEFLKVKDEVVVESYRRPEWFVPLVFADFGYHDQTAILFGYVDFLAQVLVIEDEIVESGLSLGELAARISAREKELFPELRHPIKRVADATSLELADLSRSHGLDFKAADRMNVHPRERYDDDSACSLLRTVFATKKIRILKKARKLIYQLENGIRDDKGKFIRDNSHGSLLGHCDALSALIYGNRQAPWSFRPFPIERNVAFDRYLLRLPRGGVESPVAFGTMRIPGIESWN